MVIIAAIALVLLIVASIFLAGAEKSSFYAGYGKNRKLILKSNITAKAKVLSIEKTGLFSRRFQTCRPEVKLTLEIHPDNTDPYEAEIKLSMLEETILKYPVGTMMTVILDPTDKNNFLISGLEYN